MEQRFGLARSTQSRVERLVLNHPWMRFFFTEERAPAALHTIEQQRRACWISLALLCQSLVLIAPTFTIDQSNENAWYMPFLELLGALIPCALTLGGFCALWIAIKPVTLHQQLDLARQHGARWQKMGLLRTLVLLVVGCILAVLAIVQWFSPPAYSNDGTSLDTNAARLLLKGENPYTSSSILDIAHHFHIQPGWTTPLREGQFAGRLDYPSNVDIRSAFDTALKANNAPEFESRVSYPALSFLSLVPFVFLGIYNVLPFYLLSYLLLAWLAWKVTRDELKPWVLLLALANVPMLSSAMSGSLDIFYILLLVLAWLSQEKRGSSAIFLGLALASKQLAWFFVPFYLILIWRQYTLREAGLRVLGAGALALVINLPFILWNPAAWLAGVLAPMADPMFPLGVGLINLSSYHLLPYLPSWCYLILEAGAMVGMLAYYWRICRACPEAAMLLAVLPLFFAWRSLPSYFSCTAFPIFLLMVARYKRRADQQQSPERVNLSMTGRLL
jgi:hypothetical protein